MPLIRGSIVLHRLNKGNVNNLQVSDSGPRWPSCFFNSLKIIFIVCQKMCLKLKKRWFYHINQGLYRLEKLLEYRGFLEKSLKIKI